MLMWEEVQSRDIWPSLKMISAVCMNVFKMAVILHNFSDKFNGNIKEGHSTNSCMEAPSTQCLLVTLRVAFIINKQQLDIIPDTFHAFKSKQTILFPSPPPRNSVIVLFPVILNSTCLGQSLWGFLFSFVCLFNILI
uniref:Uncharacterized protein n=1 Tax=Myotis myotis TaxID=51298 RepID=A0A7J7XH72_MYOMY|nr:hypothetical protein mMyoMyo1_011622 [Myotis myotis]